MSHERFRNLLSDYLEGSLAPEELEFAHGHMEACGECARLAESLRLTLRDLHSFPRLEVPPGFTARVLEKTSRRRRTPAPWEMVWSFLSLPRVSPAAAAALLALPIIFLAGTRDGRQMTRETSMAVHQTYSNAVRLYSRRGDLRESAVAVGRRIPGQLEETVDWLRKKMEPEGRKPPQGKPGDSSPQSSRRMDKGATA
jgi:anti-sigma factor RsiW